MIPEKLAEILKADGVAAMATLGKDGPQLVNTWNSYIKISADGRLLIPAGKCTAPRPMSPTTIKY